MELGPALTPLPDAEKMHLIVICDEGVFEMDLHPIVAKGLADLKAPNPWDRFEYVFHGEKRQAPTYFVWKEIRKQLGYPAEA